MGLDTSHDCWHGAYSAFGRWREKLAEVAGLPPLWMMEHFKSPGDEPFMSYGDNLTLQNIAATIRRVTPQLSDDADDLDRIRRWPPIPWASLEPRPLLVLLTHSDCDGEIAASDCAPLADDLASLIPLLPDGEAGGHIGHWRHKTQTFVDGLRAAAAAGEAVNFR